jgi:hemoglobin-like flavoprotein
VSDAPPSPSSVLAPDQSLAETREPPSEVPWSSQGATLVVNDADALISRTMPAADLKHPAPDPRTVTGAVIGTPLFLAPELWSGARATPCSDVYAAGLLVYELCAGELPFASHVGAELVRFVREVGLPPLGTVRPDVPRSFASVVDRAVSRAPEDRFASAMELLDALEAVHSVFRSFRTVASGGPIDDAALVAASFTRVGARVDALFVAVYERLFAEDPSLRALFPADMTEQRAKLASTIRLTIDGFRSPERLVPILQELGHRHVGYGIAPRHLQVLGRHLLSAIADFDATDWDEQTRLAWERAFGALASAMEQGMAPALRSA